MADYLGPALGSIEALIMQFTWRRFLSLLVLMFLAAVVLVSYEMYSSELELSRLQKAASILATMRQIDSVRFRTDANLLRVQQTIGSDLRVALSERGEVRDEFTVWTSIVVKQAPEKFLAAAIVWWTLAMVGIRRFHDAAIRRTIVLLLLCGTVAGTCVALMPPYSTSHLAMTAYPILSVAAILLLTIFEPAPRTASIQRPDASDRANQGVE